MVHFVFSKSKAELKSFSYRRSFDLGRSKGRHNGSWVSSQARGLWDPCPGVLRGAPNRGKSFSISLIRQDLPLVGPLKNCLELLIQK